MMLLRLISWPYVRQHAWRSLLTVLGIAIGVSVFVAMHAANQSVLGAFQDTIRRIAGATELQVTAGGSFDEEALERVQALREVAVAAPVIEAVAGTGLEAEGNLFILGVDMTGDRSLREYELASGDAAVIDDPLVFLAQPDSLMVTGEFARRNGLSTGSTLSLATIEGPRDFVVRGVLGGGGLSSAFGGNFAVMDIYAAQFVFGRGRTFDRIDVALADGVRLEEGERALRQALGEGFEVQTPASRGRSVQSLLRIYDRMVNLSSVFALVVGMFIIYNAFAIAVTQRRTEIGILRALGATRGQVALVFLGESLAGGLAGSIAGVFIGFALAGVTARSMGRVLQGAYGVPPGDIAIEPNWWILGTAVAVGTLTSVVAAALPARSAARVDPVKALQKGRLQALPAGESRVRLVLAALLGAAGASLVVWTNTLAAFYAGYLAIVVAVLTVTPVASLWTVRALRPVLSWLRPVEGALAADSLIGAPRRTATTVAALMLALALVIGLAGVALASRAAITDWADNALNPDLFVTTSPSLTARDYRFPESMGGALERVEGVHEVQRMRQVRLPYNGGRILLMATELARVGATSRRTALEGDADEMYLVAGQGRGVIGSEHLSSVQGLHVGDVIDLPTPSGTLRLPVVGIVRDYSDQQGAVMVDLSVYRSHWRDDSVDFFRIYVTPGARPDAVRQAILREFSRDRRLFVLSNQEVRQYVTGLTDQWFAVTWIQISIAILVAIIGIVNSLTVAIVDRRRELGVLRAVGAFRRQIRGTIWMEAAGIGVVSLVLGCVLGALHLYGTLEMTHRDYPGLAFDFIYPLGVVGVLFPVIVAASLLSAVAPAEAAVRGSLVEALEYE